jgi:6-phosphogluconolactonase
VKMQLLVSGEWGPHLLPGPTHLHIKRENREKHAKGDRRHRAAGGEFKDGGSQMYLRRRQFKSFRFLRAAAVVALVMMPAQVALADGNSGDVYVMTNQSGGNSVMVFHRDASGALTFAGSFATGGNGIGTGADPLGSQGAVVLSEDSRLLLAVNAGSNSVSIFAVSGDQLRLLNTVPSGGTMPVSVTVRHDLVYVLNASETPNVSGFIIDSETNRLAPLAGSTRNLPGGGAAAPAEVSFAPDRSVLVVTEKATNRVDTFTLDDGLAQPGVSFPSNGITPFGFAFAHDDVAVVSDAGSGAGTAAVSSYEVDEDGQLAVVTPALGDTQTAACWVVVPRNGRFAYTSNTGSGTISSYRISEDGHLALLSVVAASTGTGSILVDMALSDNGRFLYVRGAGNGDVAGFRIGADGSLTPVGSASGVPAGAQGIAAR